MNLQEATVRALLNKLYESKYLVDRKDWVLHNDYEAEWFGRDACWKDIRELKLKQISDEDKIRALQSLKDNIDTNITQREDYNDIEKEYISVWLDSYKSTIDRLIDEICVKGKYYIFMSVDIDDKGDVDHRGCNLIIDKGNISKGIKYYDSENEAQSDVKSISKLQYERFMYDNFVSDYDDVIQWDVSIKKYEPNAWELN